MAVKTWDPKKLVITVNGVRISEFGPGTFVSIVPQADEAEAVTGVDGTVTRVIINDPRELVTLTLAQTSPSNNYLDGVLKADRASAGLVAAGVVHVSDVGGGTTILTGQGWIQRKPDQSFDRTPTTRDWVLEVVRDDLTSVVGGNPVF